MAAYKQFTTKDITIAPFTANKGFDFVSGSITASNVGIDIFQGINPTGSVISTEAADTGLISVQNTTGVYNSVKQLYYTNFSTQSWGNEVPTQSIIPGALASDTVRIGLVEAPRYENYLQSTLTQSRNLPKEPSGSVTVVSIPQKLFGENIVPNTFVLNYGTAEIADDGEGNLIAVAVGTGAPAALYGSGFYGSGVYSSSAWYPGGEIIGQIFYSHGIAVITTSSLAIMSSNISASGKDLTDFSVSFSSSITIFEHQYKCMISENEFGFSLNPSIISSSTDLTGSLNDVYYDFATGSIFDPYVTTVGLYNESSDLLAVGKLSYPVPISKYCDTTIIINFDT
jgi:hypothetical protein|tara:strand:- start:160 stop:1182 length:1023 start_codon:yes stop_codon:yes gene_type:complete